ncbi:hypothetical protein [Leifsonia sp. AG29]|uniref:hypothetical protein n=1 Tax=Leifsonia sp. AG29 TaxID=2598860 RepID=UPI00131E6022|nr:hypothetical protein [Leifsonia sp. AG29]
MTEHEKSDKSRRHGDREHEGEEPDDALEEYENDADEQRASLEREAGLTAFGGPAFGRIFGNPPDDSGFDAQHNP